MAEGSSVLDKKTECEMAIAHVSSRVSSKFPEYPEFASKFNIHCVEESFEDIDVLRDDVAEGFDESVILEAISNDIAIKDVDKESLCITIHKLLSTFVPPRAEPRSLNIADLETCYSLEDMEAMKKLVSLYVKLLEPNNADTSIYKVLIIGQKNNIPLLTYLIDSYHRFRLALYFEHHLQRREKEEKENGMKELTLSQFCHVFCPTMKELSYRANNEVLLWYKCAMESCIHRNGLFYSLSLTQQIASKIDDSLQIFCLYSISILSSVNSLIKKGILMSFPVQIDVWIIPKNITQQIFDDDDDDDDNGNVFDIKSRLQYCHNLQSIEIESCIYDIDKLCDIFSSIICSVLNNASSRKRMVMIIDRRGLNDVFHGFLPPNTQDIANREHYLHESMINLTKTEILPSCSGYLNSDTLSGNSDCMNMFILSLHLHFNSECAMYWHYIGSCNRFCVTDMMTLWPSLFIANKQDNDDYNYILNVRHYDQLIDTNFITFYETNTESFWSDTESPLFRAKATRIKPQNNFDDKWIKWQKIKEEEAKYRKNMAQKHKIKMEKCIKSASFERINTNIERYYEGDIKIDDKNKAQNNVDINDKQCIHFIYEYDFDENGLLYFLGSSASRKEYNNPCIQHDVVVDVSSLAKDSKNGIYFVGRECVRCITKNRYPSWMSCYLNQVWIKLTHYTLKHHNSHNAALRNWTLEGSTDGNRWVVLKVHIQDESLRKPGDTKTWSIDSKSNDYFNRFRIFMTDSNSSGRWYLGCSGIELYGKAFGGLVSESQMIDFDQKEQQNNLTKFVSLKNIGIKNSL